MPGSAHMWKAKEWYVQFKNKHLIEVISSQEFVRF